jgi:hypothetical protein
MRSSVHFTNSLLRSPDAPVDASITGHIDFLVHILDYKPDARTNPASERSGFMRARRVESDDQIAVARTAGIGVRREKAALSSGCKAHPAIRSCRKQSEQSWR